MHFAIGSAYFGLQQWAEAKQAFEKAAEINANDASAAYNVAVVSIMRITTTKRFHGIAKC